MEEGNCMNKKQKPKTPPNMKLFEALKAIADDRNIQSAADYVIVSLTIDEWRTISDYVERAAQPQS